MSITSQDINNADSISLFRVRNKAKYFYVNGFGQYEQMISEVDEVQSISYISQLSDFGTPTNSVITLNGGTTYVLTADVDLLGNRLVANGVVNLFGTSSELASITSTGLGVGIPLITTDYTIVIENITIKDIDTALAIDGNSRVVALDWENVNFSNVQNVGTINTCDNFIYETGAFLSAKGLKITGTIGTVGVSNSLFVGTGSDGNIIEIDENAIITRRFRIIYSSVVATGTTVGINVNASASIPIEGYILDTVNFSGGGTYLSGLDYTSEKALFVNCVGTINTTAIGNMYMKNNAVATDVTVQGDRYAMAGVTESNGFNQKFTHVLANNSMRYDSTIPRLFRILATFTVLSGTNNIIGLYIGVKRGDSIDPDADRVSESEVYLTTSGSRPDAAAVQALTILNQNDEVYFIVQNTSATNDITIEFINLTIERTN